jgi:Uma2 family endonuclease
MKLRIEAADAVFYPDVMVSCSAADRASQPMGTEPTRIVEALSASTAGYDRGDQFAIDRRIPALAESMLVDPDTRRVDGFQRNSQGVWEVVGFADDAALGFRSVGAQRRDRCSPIPRCRCRSRSAGSPGPW